MNISPFPSLAPRTASLQSCIADLISVLALPAVWDLEAASGIIASSLDFIVGTRQLDFACLIRAGESVDAALAHLKFNALMQSPAQRRLIEQAIRCWTSFDEAHESAATSYTYEHGHFNLLANRIGLKQGCGWLLTGSMRGDYPQEDDRLIVGALTNQIALALKEADLYRQQKMAAALLEQTVQQRTAQLHTSNEALKTQIRERDIVGRMLRRNQSYLTEAERLSHMGSWAYDVLRRVPSYWSPGLCRIAGTDPLQVEELLETCQLCDTPGLQGLETIVAESIRTKTDFRSETMLRSADGSLKHLEVVGHPVIDDQGTVVELIGATLDVTAGKQARLLLSAEMQLLEMIAKGNRVDLIQAQACRFMEQMFDSAMACILLVDHDSKRLTVCAGPSLPPDYAIMLENLPTELSGESYGQCVLDGSTLIVDAIGEDTRWEACHALISRYGLQTCWSLPIQSASSLVLGALTLYFRDRRHPDAFQHYVIERLKHVCSISLERHHSQQTLAYSASLLSQAQSLSQTGSFSWHIPTGKIYWSDEAYRIWELDKDAEPTFAFMRQRIHPDDTDLFEDTLANPNFGEESTTVEFRILSKTTADTRYVRVMQQACRDAQYGVRQYIGAIRDVTAEKSTIRQLEKIRENLQTENLVLREQVDEASMYEEIVGASAALQPVLAQISKVAPTSSTVLITGETGTGKELIARAIHKRSNRADRAFVRVNCSAIPAALIASELFGHEKGAFTGALQRRLGRFELAQGGTLFMDEIGELPSETQIALLRVLQEHEFERLGSATPINADVRIIAATNRDLKLAVRNGTFRSDLFYRLAVFPIEMPPLRARADDIAMLTEYFIHRYSTKLGKPVAKISKHCLATFEAYSWPGNIRELQNVIERSLILCDSDVFSVDENWLTSEFGKSAPLATNEAVGDAARERKLIEAALSATLGRVSGPKGAALRLGVPASTLESRIRALGINKHAFKYG